PRAAVLLVVAAPPGVEVIGEGDLALGAAGAVAEGLEHRLHRAQVPLANGVAERVQAERDAGAEVGLRRRRRRLDPAAGEEAIDDGAAGAARARGPGAPGHLGAGGAPLLADGGDDARLGHAVAATDDRIVGEALGDALGRLAGR